MKSTGPEFIFRISGDAKCCTEINGLMATFAARRIDHENDTAPIAQGLEFA